MIFTLFKLTGSPYGEMMRYSNLIIVAEDEVDVDNITPRCTGARSFGKMGSVEMKYVI